MDEELESGDDFISKLGSDEIEDMMSLIQGMVRHPGYRLLRDELDADHKMMMVMMVQEKDVVTIHQMQGRIQGIALALDTPKRLIDSYQQVLSQRQEQHDAEAEAVRRKNAI